MRLLKFLLPLLLLPQFAFAAYTVPLSATTTTGTILAYPTAVNGILPILMAPRFLATSTVASWLSNASTTAFSATTICFTGDTCRTTWPTGGSGSGMASTSLARSGEITLTTTAAALTYGFSGLSTTTGAQPNSSNLLESDGKRGVFGAATSTGTVSSPLTGNFLCVGSGCTLGIQAASASQAGSMAAIDWQRLYAPTSTFSGPLVYTLSTNAVTCPTCNVSNATVSSITAGSGINGGTITTTGTFSLANFFATTTADTGGQVLYYSTTNGWPAKVSSVATGTVSAGSSAITVTANRFVLGGSLAIDCAAAGTSQNGCLSSTDWNTFNGKSGFAYPWTYNLLNTFATSTNSTSTSYWTKGVYFSSSTVAASQFPYASSTSLTVGGTFDAFGIDKAVTVLNAGSISIGSSTAFAPFSIFLSPTTTPLANPSGVAFSIASSSGYYATTTLFQITTQGVASTTNLTVSQVTNALSLMGATGIMGKYGGSSNPCTSQVPTTISALGALGGCTSINNAWWSGTQLAIGNGGTNQTAFTTSGNVVYYTGSALQTVPTNAAATFPYATTTAISTTNLTFTNATGTWLFTVNKTALYATFGATGSSTFTGIGQFATGSTTPMVGFNWTLATGTVIATEGKLFATSTAMVIDWTNCKSTSGACQMQNVQVLATAYAIGFNNASTSGESLLLELCNGGSTAGAITWKAPIIWATSYTQTTGANRCELDAFRIGVGTSTNTATSTVIYGTQTPFP